MAMTTLQIRVSEELKKDASKVFESYGFDLSTAIRIFLSKSVMIKGIPFIIGDEENFLDYMYKGELYDEKGNKYWTLSEINAEIKAARDERDKKEELEKKIKNKK